MSKIRVLQVVRPAEGGVRVHLQNIVGSLGGSIDFTVACPKEGAPDFSGYGACVEVVPLGKLLQPLSDFAVVRRLAGLLRTGNHDILHAHGFKAGLVARPAARFAGKPCIMTVHGEFAHADRSSVRPVFYGAERLLSRWTSGYITVSSWLAAELERTCGILRHRITVIPNGIIPGGDYNLRGEWPFAESSRVIGLVARLAPQKGVEYFIRAAAGLAKTDPRLFFIIVGDGPLRGELESLAAGFNLGGRLYFSGYRSDVPGILKRLHVYVQPSLSEGQGITVLEAMAAGCPVVASTAGGLPELIRHGENGMLVSPGSAVELKAAIERFLKDGALADKCTSQAAEDVKKYSMEAMLERTLNLYGAVKQGRWPE